MLLLNALRVAITILTLMLCTELIHFLGLGTWAALGVFALGMWITFCLTDLADEWIISRFNPDEEEPA